MINRTKDRYGKSASEGRNPLITLRIVSLVMILLSFLLFLLKHNVDLNMPFPTDNGELAVDIFVDAALSPDGNMLVINNEYNHLYAVEPQTNKLLWHAIPDQEGDSYSYIEDVYVDQNNNTYAYTICMDADAVNTLCECIVKYSPAGEALEHYRLKEAEENAGGMESIYGFQIIGNSISYLDINDNTLSISAYDMETGTSTVLGSHKIKDYVRIKWGSRCEEDNTFLLTCNTGEIMKISPDKVEVVATFNYSLEGDDAEGILPGMSCEKEGRLYVLNKSIGDEVYVQNGDTFELYTNLKQLYQLDENMDFYDYINEYAIDYMIMNIKPSGDYLQVLTADNIFLLKDGEVALQTDGSFQLETGMRIWAIYAQYGTPIIIGLFVLGLVLLLITVALYKPTLLKKLLFTILPILLAACAALIWVEYKRIERIYMENTEQELAAICDMAKSQIDVEKLEQVKDLSALEDGTVDALWEDVQRIFEDSGTGWRKYLSVNIYDYKENQLNRVIIGESNSNNLFDYFWFLSLEDLEEDRIGDSDVYIRKSTDMYTSYEDAVVPLRNKDGEVVALLNLTVEMERLTDELHYAQRKMLIAMADMLSTLILFIVILAVSISRRLYKTSEVIDKIAKGDFSSKVKISSRDELSVIGEGVNAMSSQIQAMIADRDEFSMQVVKALVDTIDAKDKYTNGHSIMVAEYSMRIAQRLGKNEEEQRQIYMAGLLHDIGKIGIPDEIINKETRLTDEEYDKIKRHPKIGYDILKNMSKLSSVLDGAYAHHERIDGRGYPRGLKGDEIPEIARIIGVADTYDAMTSDRSYRKKMPQAKVRDELERAKGTQLDAEFAQIMLELDLEMNPDGY